MLFLSSIIVIYLFSTCENFSQWKAFGDEPWDVDGPCQKYVERFSFVQSQMVQCSTNWSIPPKVCTNCFEQYITFKQVEYETKNLNSGAGRAVARFTFDCALTAKANILSALKIKNTVFSLDNRTCAQVIYDNYVLSYSQDISDALTMKIWEKSRCDSCLNISWNFTRNDSRVAFSQRTINFQERLFKWRDCVVNHTDYGTILTNSSICPFCKDSFNELFSYYWNIYIEPSMDFCVDVETTTCNQHEHSCIVEPTLNEQPYMKSN